MNSEFEQKVSSYQGSCGESAADRALWLPSVSIPCPRCVCVREKWGPCVSEPCGAVRCGRAGAEWEERGGSGPGWPRGERAGVGGPDRLRPLLLLRPEGHVAAASSHRISTAPLPPWPFKIKATFTFVPSIKKKTFWCLWKARGTFYLFQNKMAVISIMNCTLLKVQCAGFSGVLKPTKSKFFLSLPQISRNSSRLWNRAIMWCIVEELSVKCWIILFFSITTSKMTHLSVMIWAIWANKIWKVSHLISIQVRWALNQKLASKKSLMCTFCWPQNNRSS